MMLSLIASATLAQAMPANQLRHNVPVALRSGTATASYLAVPEVSLHQVGMDAGTRMSSKRCLWTATMAVERTLSASTATANRRLAAQQMFSGSRPGACREQQATIHLEVAARAPEFKERLLALAADDHRTLVDELRTVDAAGND
jgi:hypothetical protein